jgi:ABC-2 type transport system ATP-binding protein
VGTASKAAISYLPERTYLDRGLTVEKTLRVFRDFYADFSEEKARGLLKDLDLRADASLSKMSKGMLEKLQLIIVLSRSAKLYILVEPLGGVDPATRDYILDTILKNFCEGASVLISTHMIADIERILDDVVFIDKGKVILQAPADELRAREDAGIDAIFRRMFKC